MSHLYQQKHHNHQQQSAAAAATASGSKPKTQKELEVEEIWKQVRQVQNQTANAAREYQDVRATQKQMQGPSETAAERYQHRQVQKDFDKINESAQRIQHQTDKIIFKESDAVVRSLELGIEHLAAEKQRLEARMAALHAEFDEMENSFEAELQKLDEQRRMLKHVQIEEPIEV